MYTYVLIGINYLCLLCRMIRDLAEESFMYTNDAIKQDTIHTILCILDILLLLLYNMINFNF